ncbi:MAG TPA: SRPBCC family protein [Candidatus Krumholzibacteria bacterium]|nr:SRPBCC family protein [Candidatus Krumholzibacteria bacterium]HRX50962.1 SRPBCC family protein [Candidatus Krumholzibacteria bacterium]
MTTPRSDCELVASRAIPAPPADVFAAFADPARLARWWGPDGFTCTFHQFAFEPGGDWRFTMHSPDGQDFANESVFEEITPPSRVVLRHTCPPPFTAEMEFQAQDDGTLVVFRQIFPTADLCRRIAEYAGDANHQVLAKLAAEVEEG